MGGVGRIPSLIFCASTLHIIFGVCLPPAHEGEDFWDLLFPHPSYISHRGPEHGVGDLSTLFAFVFTFHFSFSHYLPHSHMHIKTVEAGGVQDGRQTGIGLPPDIFYPTCPPPLFLCSWWLAGGLAGLAGIARARLPPTWPSSHRQGALPFLLPPGRAGHCFLPRLLSLLSISSSLSLSSLAFCFRTRTMTMAIH